MTYYQQGAIQYRCPVCGNRDAVIFYAALAGTAKPAPPGSLQHMIEHGGPDPFGPGGFTMPPEGPSP
jgi:hypothetical protein